MESKIRRLTTLTIVSLVIAILAIGVSSYLYFTRPNIAYAYNSQILNDFQGIKEAKQLYQKKLETWQANLDTLESDLQRDIQEYESQKNSLTTNERRLKEELIREKQKNYEQYRQAVEEKARQEDQQMSGAILKQIDSYILEYGKTHDYDYIIGVNDNGNLLYATDKKDVTQDLLNKLNQEYAGK